MIRPTHWVKWVKSHALQSDYTEAAPRYNRRMNETKPLPAAMGSRSLLLLAIAAIAVIWQLPYGQLALYPFSLLATYAHEMGHGLSALLVGAEFDRIVLHADGSGMAYWRGDPGPLGSALVAAGGLLGPTVAGVTLLLLARSPRLARILLAMLAALVLLTLAFWARNLFAIGFLFATSALLAAGARWLPDLVVAFLLHFIAALLCLAWVRDLGYMFSNHAFIDGVAHPSDSAMISSALVLPYWFWGGLVALVSLALLALGLWVATRRDTGIAQS